MPSLALSGGRRPLEMKYTFPNTLSHVVSEYIWFWGSIFKTLGVVACLFLQLQEGDALWYLNLLIQVTWIMSFHNICIYGGLSPKP